MGIVSKWQKKVKTRKKDRRSMTQMKMKMTKDRNLKMRFERNSEIMSGLKIRIKRTSWKKLKGRKGLIRSEMTGQFLLKIDRLFTKISMEFIGIISIQERIGMSML